MAKTMIKKNKARKPSHSKSVTMKAKSGAKPAARKTKAGAVRKPATFGRSKTIVEVKRPIAKTKKSHARPVASPDGLLHKVLRRFKPLFQKPLDPRIRHLVEVFGEEAVRGLIQVYRKTREVEEMEIADAVKRAQSGAAPPPHGTFVWHELATNDVSGCKRFYGELFGWKHADDEMMPDFNYTLFRHLGKEAAGMMTITPEQGDVRPGWTLYVSVDDVDAAAAKAETLGGEVVVPPHDIPLGRWAMLKDPSGATICVFRRK